VTEARPSGQKRRELGRARRFRVEASGVQSSRAAGGFVRSTTDGGGSWTITVSLFLASGPRYGDEGASPGVEGSDEYGRVLLHKAGRCGRLWRLPRGNEANAWSASQCAQTKPRLAGPGGAGVHSKTLLRCRSTKDEVERGRRLLDGGDRSHRRFFNPPEKAG